jgi:tetratricopeptide (TPR) repeat protein
MLSLAGLTARTHDFTPAKPDIARQFDVLLTAKRFSTASTQLRFLSFVVKRALQGKPSPEDLIGRKLFPGFLKDEDTSVRVTASNLRKSLRRYYESEGREDLVVIALPEPPLDKSIKLPPGAAYTPTFFYNPNHAASKEFRLGRYFLERGVVMNFGRALTHFEKACEIAPNHIGGMLGKSDGQDRSEQLLIAESFIERALLLAPQSWRVHATQAFLFHIQGDLSATEREYNVALALDPDRARAYSPYLAYLIRQKRFSELLQIAEHNLVVNIDDPVAHLHYSDALELTGRIAEAEQVLQDALYMDRGSFKIRTGLAFFYARQDRGPEALEQLAYLEKAMDGRTFYFINNFVNLVIARHCTTISATPRMVELLKKMSR